MKKTLLVLLFLSLNPLHSIWFENRYLLPDLCPTPLLTYRQSQSYIAIQPFIMGTDGAYPGSLTRSSHDRVGVYEIGGKLTLANLDQALMEAGITSSTLLRSEWLLQNLQIPIKLGGRIYASGLAWNIGYSLADNILLGWSGAGYKLEGILQLSPFSEQPNSALNESEMYEILNVYQSMTSALNLQTKPYSRANFADNDLYLRYSYFKDRWLRMYRIKGILQAGVFIPTAHTQDLNCVSSIPSGCDKHFGAYLLGELDFVLKEDITLSFAGRAQYNAKKILNKRIPLLNEPVPYGVATASVAIKPGWTGYFSPSLTVEGIRDGLGCKLGYSVVHHGHDTWTLLSSSLSEKNLNLSAATAHSSWGQEHVLVSLFYDFTRDTIEHLFEPFVGFSIQFPVDWFASKNSASTTALSCIIETLY